MDQKKLRIWTIFTLCLIILYIFFFFFFFFDILRYQILKHPLILRNDNGPKFTSYEYKTVSQERDCKDITSGPRYPK